MRPMYILTARRDDLMSVEYEKLSEGVLNGANAVFTYGAGGVWLWRQNQTSAAKKSEYPDL